MQVSVVGTGSVGATLLYFLAENARIDEVLVVSRRPESGIAAILDVASASPRGAAKLRSVPACEMFESDVVILACGEQIKATESLRDIYEQNAAITCGVLASVTLKPTALVITLAAPVDDVTVLAQRQCRLPHAQVFGFGGDLDRNRLDYLLRERARDGKEALVVGEHGANAIPVYDPAEDYGAIAGELRRFLGKIVAGGPLRNLAAGVLLGQLVDTIAADSGRVHHVCGYHPQHGVYLTWPFRAGRHGLRDPETVALGGSAKQALENLVAARRARVE